MSRSSRSTSRLDAGCKHRLLLLLTTALFPKSDGRADHQSKPSGPVGAELCKWLDATYDNTQEIQPRDADQPTGSAGYVRSLKFAGNSDFQVEFRRRIDEFFRSTGGRQRDCPQMYDIELGGLGRLTPHRRRLWVYRWQQYYLWPLYGFMAMSSSPAKRVFSP